MKPNSLPSPLSLSAFAINSAALESPSAVIIAANLACSAFSTKNLAFSASCWATCLASTAFVNSCPNVKCVYCYIKQLNIFSFFLFTKNQPKITIEISSNIKPNCWALSVNILLICCETLVRCVINSLASNCAFIYKFTSSYLFSI